MEHKIQTLVLDCVYEYISVHAPITKCGAFRFAHVRTYENILCAQLLLHLLREYYQTDGRPKCVVVQQAKHFSLGSVLT